MRIKSLARLSVILFAVQVLPTLLLAQMPTANMAAAAEAEINPHAALLQKLEATMVPNVKFDDSDGDAVLAALTALSKKYAPAKPEPNGIVFVHRRKPGQNEPSPRINLNQTTPIALRKLLDFVAEQLRCSWTVDGDIVVLYPANYDADGTRFVEEGVPFSFAVFNLIKAEMRQVPASSANGGAVADDSTYFYNDQDKALIRNYFKKAGLNLNPSEAVNFAGPMSLALEVRPQNAGKAHAIIAPLMQRLRRISIQTSFLEVTDQSFGQVGGSLQFNLKSGDIVMRLSYPDPTRRQPRPTFSETISPLGDEDFYKPVFLGVMDTAATLFAFQAKPGTRLIGTTTIATVIDGHTASFSSAEEQRFPYFQKDRLNATAAVPAMAPWPIEPLNTVQRIGLDLQVTAMVRSGDHPIALALFTSMTMFKGYVGEAGSGRSQGFSPNFSTKDIYLKYDLEDGATVVLRLPVQDKTDRTNLEFWDIKSREKESPHPRDLTRSLLVFITSKIVPPVVAARTTSPAPK